MHLGKVLRAAIKSSSVSGLPDSQQRHSVPNYEVLKIHTSGFRQKQVTGACNHQNNYAAAAAAWSSLLMTRPSYRKELSTLAGTNCK